MGAVQLPTLVLDQLRDFTASRGDFIEPARFEKDVLDESAAGGQAARE